MGLLILVSAAWPWEEKLEPEGESAVLDTIRCVGSAGGRLQSGARPQEPVSPA